MHAPSILDTDVLIVGAGPTGPVLALWLTQLAVRVRIVDKTAEPGTTSRALAVQARTLELYRQVGLADAVVARGIGGSGVEGCDDRVVFRSANPDADETVSSDSVCLKDLSFRPQFRPQLAECPFSPREGGDAP